MPEYETFEHDVLVIGAGGAGLRAAIEASAAGVRVGLVCKSLLGKAHTVMAEGGIAGALGNLDKKDNWQVHFMDTMKGGGFLNNWRTAQLLAQEAPERVLELEQWGAVFDRTPDGLIMQRPFGGHTSRLLKDGDRVVGAFGYYRESGRFLAIKAKAVVLATGGWGRMYKVTSNSWESTGDGAVLAF